jgi:hypothetical protein
MGLFYCQTGYGLMMASNYKTYGIGVISHDDNFFSLVGSVGGLFNGLSRFFWASLLDYLSPSKLMYINIVMMMVLSATFNLVASSKACFMLWMILLYAQYGGLFTYFPFVTTQVIIYIN